MSEINVSVGGGPGVVVSVAGDGTTATVTTGGTVNVTLTESNPTWSGIAGKPSTFPPQAHSHFIADTVGLQAALNEKADLDAGGKVPASQLPSYVDDVLEFANLAALPATGETGKIYVTTGNGKIYRWSGTTYIEISAAPGSTDFVPEGTTNLYHTTARAAAAAPVQSVAGRTGTIVLDVGDVANAVGTSDARLSDSREWSAATVSQADAEAGTSASRLAFTPQRVFQAIAAWWAGSAAKAKLDGIAVGATANATDAQLRNRSTHTGTQLAATISDFASAVVAAAPPTTNASLLTSGTLPDARLSSNIARTSDVSSAVAAVVNAAPATLDTLNELAAALGNDANFASTVTTALAAKAPLASPTFTGTVGGITKSMVGLGNVDNTADASKPVSTAQAAADAAVASAAAADATSKAAAAQAAAVQRANHTGTQAIATVDGLQAALDGKAAATHSHAIADVTGLQTALDGKQASGSYAAASHGHDAATTSAAGFLSTADKTKLDGIATGATANATDAQLRDRSTHTGTQTASTISDFASAVVAAAPPTTNASLLTSGTLPDARLSSNIARTSDVSSAVAAVVNAAPATLDTLNELAAALGNDANFATTVTNSLAAKAAAVHTHVIADVTGLQSALDGKQASGSYAAAVHTHGISDVTGLQTALDGKAVISHVHSASDITSGTINAARLGSGIASNATFLRGDGTWASVIQTIIDGGSATTSDGGVVDGGSATTV